MLCLAMHAQRDIHGTFDKNIGVVPGGYNFWFFTPREYETDKHPLPVIIFLHGASLCGNNMDRVRRYGTLDAIEKGKIINTFVIAPQNPGGAWKPSKIKALLDWAEANYAIDTTRVYVLGMSLGGYGTLDFCGTYPDKVAAAMALCGGCSLRDMSGLGRLPLWIMHGTADRAVGLQQSKRVVTFLQRQGTTDLLRYDWIRGYDHGIFARFFYLQKTYDWLISHSTADQPRTVDRVINIDNADVRATYNDLRKVPEMFEED